MSTKRAASIAKDCRVFFNPNQTNFGNVLNGSLDDQFNSIDLNKFGATKILQSSDNSIISSKNNENAKALQNLTGFVKVSDFETNKGYSTLWQKDNLLKSNGYRQNLQEDKAKEYKGNNKNFDKNSNKNSTLSLHIEAYENANEVQNNVEAKVVNDLKASKMDKFGIPRQQQQEKLMEAEMMAFKLSKPLLNISGMKRTDNKLHVLKPHPRQLMPVRNAGFMRGAMPLRRTFFYLEQGKVILRDDVAVLCIGYHLNPSPEQKGAADFIYWNWAQLQYKNPHIQLIKKQDFVVTPFAMAILKDNREVLFNFEGKTRDQIEENLQTILGKTSLVRRREFLERMQDHNPAEFGVSCSRQCSCEIPGQQSCTSLLVAPSYLKGKWRWNHNLL